MKDIYQNFLPNGTSDDLMTLLIRANALRYAKEGITIPNKSKFAHLYLEPLCNLLGMGLTAIAQIISPAKIAEIHQTLFARLAAPTILPFAEQAPTLQAARRLAAQVSTETGKAPAILCLFTHPPVYGNWEKLNIELTRHALWGMSWLRSQAARPKLVVAIDGLALDRKSLISESIYAGFMGTYHLGLDRLGTHRRGLSRYLLGHISSNTMIYRLNGALQRREEVAISPAGGVATTSRALYTVREHLYALRDRRDRSLSPNLILQRLGNISDDFAAFQKSELIGTKLHSSAWKMMDAWLIALLTGGWGIDDAKIEQLSVQSGLLSVKAEAAFLACAQAMGVAQLQQQQALKNFAEEFQCETPVRLRLFRILARRVVGKGTPILLLPLAHDVSQDDVRINWGEPMALMNANNQQLTTWEMAGENKRERTISLDDFARELNRKNFI